MRRRAIAARQAKVLAPSTQEPSFTGDGKTARHQDVITISNKRQNERPLHSQTLQPDGVLETLHDRKLAMARKASAAQRPAAAPVSIAASDRGYCAACFFYMRPSCANDYFHSEAQQGVCLGL